jgi:hypothetical protein
VGVQVHMEQNLLQLVCVSRYVRSDFSLSFLLSPVRPFRSGISYVFFFFKKKD